MPLSFKPRISLHITQSPFLPSITDYPYFSTTMHDATIQDSPSEMLAALLNKRGRHDFGPHKLHRLARQDLTGPYLFAATSDLGTSTSLSDSEPTTYPSRRDYSIERPVTARSYSRSPSPGSSTTIPDKPLPPVPSRTSLITPQAIISLLDLLDNCDNDVAMQVARVEENIQEAKQLIRECRSEREVMRKLAKRKSMKELMETKAVDDEFWLHV